MVCFSLQLSCRSCKVRLARVDPLPFHVKNDATGLGKTSQDFRMIETTVSQRRELDSERQRNETEEQRIAREVSTIDTSLYYLTRIILLRRETSLVAPLFRPKYQKFSDHFTAPPATSNFKTSPNMTNTPIHTLTITRFVSVRCKVPSGPSRIPRRSRTGAKKRSASVKRRSYARLPPQLG